MSVRGLAVFLLRSYKRFLSPLLPPMCRFEPTCSVYMQDAVQKYGAARGIWLGVRRLGRCHPFNPGGWDPVP
jgi:putative membrane protein insertion efficiency factor